MKQTDVLIIGGGICGCALLYELAGAGARATLAERENDLACATTKANSAILHAGYDPAPGSLMSRSNIEGNRLIYELAERLDVPCRQTGSLVAALSEEDLSTLEELYQRGRRGGVPDLRILSREETLAREPALNPAVLGALYAPTAGIVSPWELALALAETAVRGGAEVLLDTEVTALAPAPGGGYVARTGRGELRADFVVNAAGVSSGAVMDMLDRRFAVTPSRGQYFLLDKSMGDLVKHIVFPCPDKYGKGVLVTPTVHGNLLVGPNSETGGSAATTDEGLAFVRERGLRLVPGIDFGAVIRTFAGVRAISGGEDFIVGRAEGFPRFYNMAGIRSPGLTSAPALARELAALLIEDGLPLSWPLNFPQSRRVIRFGRLTQEERARLAARDGRYGAILCRCETVTEGEVLDALQSPIPPRSLDGVKRRVGAGMGRCQGGFCGMRVARLLSGRLGLPIEEIVQDRAGSWMVAPREQGEGGDSADV